MLSLPTTTSTLTSTSTSISTTAVPAPKKTLRLKNLPDCYKNRLASQPSTSGAILPPTNTSRLRSIFSPPSPSKDSAPPSTTMPPPQKPVHHHPNTPSVETIVHRLSTPIIPLSPLPPTPPLSTPEDHTYHKTESSQPATKSSPKSAPKPASKPAPKLTPKPTPKPAPSEQFQLLQEERRRAFSRPTTCPEMLTRGIKKGSPCGRKCVKNESFCRVHVVKHISEPQVTETPTVEYQSKIIGVKGNRLKRGCVYFFESVIDNEHILATCNGVRYNIKVIESLRKEKSVYELDSKDYLLRHKLDGITRWGRSK